MITLSTAIALATAVLSTSFLSGVFGMAGGIILIAILLVMMPVASAMVLQGATQFVGNAWRAWLWRSSIRWQIFYYYVAGAALAFGALSLVRFTPDKPVALIAIGVIGFAGLWLPAGIAPDITKRWHSFGCGALCTVLHLIAGVSGPVLDVSFVRTNLNRMETVATKAVVQALGHLTKVIYFGQILAGSSESVAPAAIALALVAAVIGTHMSRHILDIITDAQFRTWSRGLIVGIAALCLLQGVYLLGAAQARTF